MLPEIVISVTNTVMTPRIGSDVLAGRSKLETLVAFGYGGLVLAMACILGLHLLNPPSVPPVSAVISDYALVDGFGWLLLVALVSIGGVLAVIATGLQEHRQTAGGWTRAGLWLAAAGACIGGVFPTDEELLLSLVGQIHRYGAVTMLIAVPIIGLLVARRLRGTAADSLRRVIVPTAVVTAVVLVAFLVAHVESMPASYIEVKGLLQRLTVLGEVVLLAQLLAIPQRLTSPLQRVTTIPQQRQDLPVASPREIVRHEPSWVAVASATTRWDVRRPRPIVPAADDAPAPATASAASAVVAPQPSAAARYGASHATVFLRGHQPAGTPRRVDRADGHVGR